jgi:hypothetical protein
VQQVLADAELAEDALPRGRDLERLAGDRQDQQVADQRRQRAVVGEHPAERNGRDQRDHVVGDHRTREAGRLARFRAAEAVQNGLNALQQTY